MLHVTEPESLLHGGQGGGQVWRELPQESRLWQRTTPCAPTIRRIMANSRQETEKMLNHDALNHYAGTLERNPPGSGPTGTFST